MIQQASLWALQHCMNVINHCLTGQTAVSFSELGILYTLLVLLWSGGEASSSLSGSGAGEAAGCQLSHPQPADLSVQGVFLHLQGVCRLTPSQSVACLLCQQQSTPVQLAV